MAQQGRLRLFDLNRERDAIIRDVKHRILAGSMHAAWGSRERGLEYVLNEAAYFEMSRLDGLSKKRHKGQYTFWHDIAHSVGRNAEDVNADILSQLVENYAADIVGNFNPSVFRFTTTVLPFGLSTVFNAQGLSMFRGVQRMGERVRAQGEIDHLRRLAERGTLVFMPTHSSNMDSILVGWSLENVQLPPVTYGAGKNLFRAPLTAFFMRNLGAYKVDRRIRHSLYKDILKTVSQVLIERGFHSLFFPGGTRSRSGRVERSLKLGLAGTTLTAYIERIKAGRGRRVYLIPVTLNYHLVLEAETLISEFLRTDGRSRFIIEDDEFSDLGRIARFSMNTMALDNPLVLHYGEPMDPFGNRVDLDGESIDPNGRTVDPRSYVMTADGYDQDPTRDREYTRWLGVRVGEAFLRNTVLFSIHVVARALFEILRDRYPTWDLYATIRFARGDFVERTELLRYCDRLLGIIRRLHEQERVRVGPVVGRWDADDLLETAYQYFTMYHTTDLVQRRGTGYELANLPLIYYYGNRTRGFGIRRLLR